MGQEADRLLPRHSSCVRSRREAVCPDDGFHVNCRVYRIAALNFSRETKERIPEAMVVRQTVSSARGLVSRQGLRQEHPSLKRVGKTRSFTKVTRVPVPNASDCIDERREAGIAKR